MREGIFNRNFVLLIAGQVSSVFATILLKFTVSLLILDLTGSPALFGAITAAGYLPSVLLSPVCGVLADRKNKRSLMAGLDCIYCAAAALMAFTLTLPGILTRTAVIMVGMSAAASLETPVVQSSIPLIQTKDTLVRSNAVVSQINMFAGLTAPLAAGMLYGAAGKDGLSGVGAIFRGCAVCFFLAAVMELFITIPEVELQKTGVSLQTVRADLAECVCFLTSEQICVFRIILLNAAFVLLIQPFITTGAPFIIRIVLGLDSVLVGLSQALMGAAGLAGGVIAAAAANRLRADKIHWLFWIIGGSIAAFGVSLMLACPVKIIYIVLAAAGIVIFMSAGIAGIIIMSAIQQNVPQHMMGRIMSFYSAVVGAALPAGIFLYGYLYERFAGHLYLILILTAACVFAIGYMGKRTYGHLGEG